MTDEPVRREWVGEGGDGEGLTGGGSAMQAVRPAGDGPPKALIQKRNGFVSEFYVTLYTGQLLSHM